MSSESSQKSNPQDTKGLLDRLARIEGQIRGVKRMVSEQAYCIDLINQIHSVRRALDGVSTAILEDHLKHCVHDAIESEDPYEEQEKIEEFMDTVRDVLKKG